MKRRDFSLQLAAAGLGTVWAGVAGAQGAPVEGTHYTKLSQPQPVSVPAGKIEVLEFFSYGCPHCYALEPTLEAWVKRLPPDVVFRRVPVAFLANYENFQRIYFALEAMGQVDAMQMKIFNAVHQQRLRLDKEADIAAFMSANGVDGAKFAELFKSFTVQTKARQAQQLTQAYKIDGVPALAVQGRYLTSGSQAGSNERALAVTDALVQSVRKPA
jgi:thiol:disulfide interchange protein DsbA